MRACVYACVPDDCKATWREVVPHIQGCARGDLAAVLIVMTGWQIKAASRGMHHWVVIDLHAEQCGGRWSPCVEAGPLSPSPESPLPNPPS